SGRGDGRLFLKNDDEKRNDLGLRRNKSMKQHECADVALYNLKTTPTLTSLTHAPYSQQGEATSRGVALAWVQHYIQTALASIHLVVNGYICILRGIWLHAVSVDGQKELCITKQGG
ncbi:hypothetical protein ANCDUO_24840, partial [Ancylostoma duodenale]